MGFGKPRQGDMVTYHDMAGGKHAALVNTVHPDKGDIKNLVNLTVFFPTGQVGVQNVTKTIGANGHWSNR